MKIYLIFWYNSKSIKGKDKPGISVLEAGMQGIYEGIEYDW